MVGWDDMRGSCFPLFYIKLRSNSNFITDYFIGRKWTTFNDKIYEVHVFGPFFIIFSWLIIIRVRSS